MLRLFVGWDLPPDLRGRLQGLAAGLPGAVWTPSENLHMTLRFIGEADEDLALSIDAELSRIDLPAMRLDVEGLGFFEARGRPVRLWARVLSTPALDHLQRRVEQAVQRAGLAPESRRFLPHISLARLKETRRLASYLESNSLLHAESGLDALTLFSSHLGRGQPHYEAERVYALRPVGR